MLIGTIPTYKDIFDDTPPSFSELITRIPSQLIISIVSMMNGELFLNQNNPKAHEKILLFLIRRQSRNIRLQIFNKIYGLIKSNRGDSFSLFSTQLNLYFLHKALQHESLTDDNREITPEEELKLLKAYFVSNSEYYSQIEIKTNQSSPVESLRKNMWPLMIDQFLLNNPYNYFNSIVKALSFFEAIECHSDYGKYVKTFTKRYGDNNSVNYVFRFSEMLKTAKTSNENQKFSPFFLKPDDKSIPFFDDLSLDIKTYKINYSEQPENYTGFKSQPLFKYNYGVYFVISWDLLARKIYDSMIFDFYQYSGIRQEKKMKAFDSFKNFIGSEVTEKYLFKNLISATIINKHHIINFDENQGQGHPDAYIRKGKKILLFEIKDSLLSKEVIESKEYEKIKDAIDQKYNSSSPNNKGTFQLIEQIKKLAEKPFEDNTYSELKLKKRNLIIYPILIYTDPHFDLPGIGDYLNEEFNELLKSNNLENKFEVIKDLSFISIDFLIKNLDILQLNDYSIEILIDKVIKDIKNKKRKYSKNNNLKDLKDLFNDFDSLVSKHLKNAKPKNDYVKTVFEKLNLGKGLS